MVTLELKCNDCDSFSGSIATQRFSPGISSAFKGCIEYLRSWQKLNMYLQLDVVQRNCILHCSFPSDYQTSRHCRFTYNHVATFWSQASYTGERQ